MIPDQQDPSSVPSSTELGTLQCHLRLAHRRHGAVPVRELAKKVGNSISASTINRVFTGRTLPTWQSLETVLEAIGISEVEIRQVWLPRWGQLKNLLDPIQGTAVTAVPTSPMAPAGSECGQCGAWVTNPELHLRFHDQFVLRDKSTLVQERVRDFLLNNRQRSA